MFLNDHYDDPMNVLGNTGYIIANFFADALLVRVHCFVFSSVAWMAAAISSTAATSFGPRDGGSSSSPVVSS